jgi:hypothetical protein
MTFDEAIHDLEEFMTMMINESSQLTTVQQKELRDRLARENHIVIDDSSLSSVVGKYTVPLNIEDDCYVMNVTEGDRIVQKKTLFKTKSVIEKYYVVLACIDRDSDFDLAKQKFTFVARADSGANKLNIGQKIRFRGSLALKITKNGSGMSYLIYQPDSSGDVLPDERRPFSDFQAL